VQVTIPGYRIISLPAKMAGEFYLVKERDNSVKVGPFSAADEL